MSTGSINLNKEDFLNSKWDEIIKECTPRECIEYFYSFSKKVQEYEGSGNIKAKKMFSLLACITSPGLKADDCDEFFAEVFNWLSEVDLKFLEEIVTEISDNELKARVADILWVKQRSYKMAQVAVLAYIESAKDVEKCNHWWLYVDRIERAVHLAASLGRKNHYFTDVIAHIEVVVDRYNGEESLGISGKLMRILLEQRQGVPSKYAILAEKAATLAEAMQDWDRARTYWEIKAQWHQREQNTHDERTALICAAETYVKASEEALKLPSLPYTNASDELQKAIEALRKVGGTEARRDELHNSLLEYQQLSLAEMIPISQEVDISYYVDKAREKVKDKSIHDALFILAIQMGSYPQVSYLRQQVEENTQAHVLQSLIPIVMKNEMGKVTAREPSILSSDLKERESAIRSKMFQTAIWYWQMQAKAIIEPVRYQINLEHSVRVSDFFSIVVNNPFIPQGREYIYAKGFHAGLTGDFLVAAHILIPQIENSLRYIFKQKGIITSGLNDYGIQDEHDINTLFRERESDLVEIFGEDITFHLQGLLVHRFGCNLRNRMAHGLLDYESFFAPEVSYLWWMALHLCCRPLVTKIDKNKDEEGQSTNTTP